MIQKLNPFHAFKPGSEIWFLPEKKISQWARQLDWYINFLQANSLKKSKRNISDSIKATIQNEELDLPQNSTYDSHTLLISTHEYLPNKAVAIVKNVSDITEWVEWIQKTTQNFKSESIRIFLPKNLSFVDVKKSLSVLPEKIEVTVVEDGTLIQEK